LHTTALLGADSDGYFTIRLAVLESVAAPAWPVNVTVYVPATAWFGTVSVTLALADKPLRVTAAGDTAHVVVAGPPPQLNETFPVNPLTGVIVRVYVAFFPVTVWNDGNTCKRKSGMLMVTPGEMLPVKLLSPEYSAVSVRPP
jgi:hypothetical protein